MRRLLILISSTLVLAFAASPVRGITYGESDAGAHPNVGVIVADWRPQTEGELDTFCSGTLISPTVFLTASHCTYALEHFYGVAPGDVFVSFDQVIDLTTDDGDGTSTLLSGTYHTNPDFGHDMADYGDVAVIVLDAPVVGITPALIPELGYFDEFSARELHGQTFTAVGYGALEPTFGGGPPVFGDTDERMVAVSTYRSMTATWLRLSQNVHTGDGGTCYGDSGGPNFIGDTNVIAGVTVTGDAMCLAMNTIYRLDTVSAQTFLGQFVTLPGTTEAAAETSSSTVVTTETSTALPSGSMSTPTLETTTTATTTVITTTATAPADATASTAPAETETTSQTSTETSTESATDGSTTEAGVEEGGDTTNGNGNGNGNGGRPDAPGNSGGKEKP